MKVEVFKTFKNGKTAKRPTAVYEDVASLEEAKSKFLESLDFQFKEADSVYHPAVEQKYDQNNCCG